MFARFFNDNISTTRITDEKKYDHSNSIVSMSGRNCQMIFRRIVTEYVFALALGF